MFEQLLDAMVDLSDPAIGLEKLTISMIQSMVLSEYIINKIAGRCHRLLELCIVNDPEAN